MRSGTKRRHETTIGWQLLVQWKDGSTNWVALKDLKESYLVQVAKYSVATKISMEPAFAWWVPHTHLKSTTTLSQKLSQRRCTSSGLESQSQSRKLNNWIRKMETPNGGMQSAKKCRTSGQRLRCGKRMSMKYLLDIKRSAAT